MLEKMQQSVETFDCREAFANSLEALAQEDERLVAIVNDSVGSSKLGNFKKHFPQRTINVGIAEQNMVGVAAGLASAGKVPFVSGASCFLTGRALEQIKVDVAYSNANVKLCGMSSGVAYGELGPTHHSIEDIAWLRPLPNLTILVPADPWETAEAVRFAARHKGPVFIRVSRLPVPDLHGDHRKFEPGKATVLREGDDLAILANGVLTHRAVEAADRLSEMGIEARVVNMSSVSPLDEAAILKAAETGAIVTAEEHSTRGGLGGAVAELVARRKPVHLNILGFPGFAPTGSAEWLLTHFGLSVEGITTAAQAVLLRKNAG